MNCFAFLYYKKYFMPKYTSGHGQQYIEKKTKDSEKQDNKVCSIPEQVYACIYLFYIKKRKDISIGFQNQTVWKHLGQMDGEKTVERK